MKKASSTDCVLSWLLLTLFWQSGFWINSLTKSIECLPQDNPKQDVISQKSTTKYGFCSPPHGRSWPMPPTTWDGNTTTSHPHLTHEGQTPLGCRFGILACMYQLWARIQQSIFVDIRPCPAMGSRPLVLESNIQLRYEAWTFQLLWQNDSYIMETLADVRWTNSQLEQLNACKMYLQVTTLASYWHQLLLKALGNTNLMYQKEWTVLANHGSSGHQSTHPCQNAGRLMKTICHLYMGLDKRRYLHHPLGEWTQSTKCIASGYGDYVQMVA